MMNEDAIRKPLQSQNSIELTRRRMLQAMAAGAVAATIGFTFPGQSSAQATAPAGLVPLRALPFNLKDVRLLDGPFLDAQKRNEKYLMQLEPDRLLHNFRINAKLEPKAPIYGGWESEATWADIRCHGHTLGHYLTACSMMFASTGDAQYRQRVDYCISELRECQNATPGGLVCAFPDGATQIENMVAGRRAVGVPWYTMHKIFAGLRDAHLYCGSADALAVLVKLADWAEKTTQGMTDAQFERMLRIEHGGMNEVLGDVYVLTGEARYLALARRFCHRAVLEPLAQSRDTLDGLHSNTQIPKFIGFSRLFALTGDDQYKAASTFFWDTVVHNRSFATGGNGDVEHFFPPAQFQRHLSSAKTMETCCSHNMLKLTRSLFELNPTAAYADYYERTLYNAILASQDPDSGMMTYFQPTRPGYLKLYCKPFESFWCCTGSGMENHAKYGDSIYFHDDETLWVNLFIPSTAKWAEKGLTITQTTKFPEEPVTKLQFATSAPVEMTLKVRHPAWCAAATVKVNGMAWNATSKPGSYIEIDRPWKDGDTVEVQLPMTLRTEPLPGSPNLVAFVYGPIVLAGKLGTEGIAPGADIIQNERTIGEVLSSVEVPVLTGDAATILEKVKPVEGKPLTFATDGVGKPNDITLVPYYRIAHEHYNLYWTLSRS